VATVVKIESGTTNSWNLDEWESFDFMTKKWVCTPEFKYFFAGKHVKLESVVQMYAQQLPVDATIYVFENKSFGALKPKPENRLSDMIRPIPEGKGLGFFSSEHVPLMMEAGYRPETIHLGTHSLYNYHFTPHRWRWPFPYVADKQVKIIDGFSPNLNKQLHVGHLRNLALANAFQHMNPHWRFVSILGSSIGCYKASVTALKDWFSFVGYRPDTYYDSLMPWDEVPRQPGTGKNTGAQVWISPTNEEVVVMRSNLTELVCPHCDERLYRPEGKPEMMCPGCGTVMNKGKSTIAGRPNYVFCDIAFAKTVKPDYYVTAAEQVDHFKMLGMGEKHLAMGLVQGTDGKKLKSRTGDALSVDEAMEMIQSRFDETPEPKKLAWNVLAWNFLHVTRGKNVKFDPVEWTSPDSPGMYISYTYARLCSAVQKAIDSKADYTEPKQEDLTELDIGVLGYLEYGHYWMRRSIENMDPAPFANYLYDLCQVLTNAYNKERICGGRQAFYWTMRHATVSLISYMSWIGLFPIAKV